MKNGGLWNAINAKKKLPSFIYHVVFRLCKSYANYKTSEISQRKLRLKRVEVK